MDINTKVNLQPSIHCMIQYPTSSSLFGALCLISYHGYLLASPPPLFRLVADGERLFSGVQVNQRFIGPIQRTLPIPIANAVSNVTLFPFSFSHSPTYLFQ